MYKNILTCIMLMIALALASCVDEDSFTQSPSARLVFSSDTIRLDTVFSKVPSSTRTFWVYNRNPKAVRCSSIRLKSGNQKGFRVNVNGIYIGETQGWQLSDEEIMKGDSLRVFVEATTPYNGGDGPVMVSDELLFRLENGAEQKVALEVWSWDADIIRGLEVKRDTTLSSAKPTVIYGGITVAEGATLTLPAGKTLYMHSGAGITVRGTLKCLGEPGNEVVLRGDRLDRMFDYLPYDGVSGQWDGVLFCSESYGNILRYTELHAATDAIVCDSADVNREKLSIEHSTIHNNKGSGVRAASSRLVITNSQITNALGDCVAVTGGDTRINSCTIAQFYPFDANRGSALSFADHDGGKDMPISQLDVSNTIVTGYADDVVMAYMNDTVSKPYTFNHCLLRTPAPADTVRFRNIVWEEVEDTVVAGWKNFKKIDTELLRYDFSLAPTSLAIDSADPLTSPVDDRNGDARDDKPDMGCYEGKEETTPK